MPAQRHAPGLRIGTSARIERIRAALETSGDPGASPPVCGGGRYVRFRTRLDAGDHIAADTIRPCSGECSRRRLQWRRKMRRNRHGDGPTHAPLSENGIEKGEIAARPARRTRDAGGQSEVEESEEYPLRFVQPIGTPIASATPRPPPREQRFLDEGRNRGSRLQLNVPFWTGDV